MNLSAPFIRRPVATTLLMVALTLLGTLAFFRLPMSPLPEVDFPTISVTTVLPGASPETMASSVATPLERQFGRIAGITEMTATNFLGVATITLQFDLNRDINAAAREVEAAINAASGSLPPDLPNSPNYKKVNPSDFPIMILTLVSDTLDRGQIYDAASTLLQQKLAQVDGVGQVNVGGASLPGVRVEVNPNYLNRYGLSLEDVRAVLAAANTNLPKGALEDDSRAWSIGANDQLFTAADYRELIVAFRNSAPVRLGDVAEVLDSVADKRNSTYLSGVPGINLDIRRQTGANIVATIDRIKALLPELQAMAPGLVKIRVWVDQTVTIRASIQSIEKALLISIALVVLVVFAFLRDLRATLIPAIVVPVCLVASFGVMYACGFSLNNLTLMALTVATSFLADDAIVTVENVKRHIEQGMAPLPATRRGAAEIGTTILTICIALLAAFIPLLLMDGIIGRLFFEFAVTLAAAIAISTTVSLTLTPVLCSRLLLARRPAPGAPHRRSGHLQQALAAAYARSLRAVLGNPALVLTVTLLVIALNVYLFLHVPKGFFPQQDTGRIQGNVIADQSASFGAIDERVRQVVDVIKDDPAVESVLGQTGQWAGSGGVGGGGSSMNIGRVSLTLKPWEQRKPVTADQVIARLRPRLSQFPGTTVAMQAVQDIRIGARQAPAQYQYTLQGENLADLTEWAPRLLQKLRTLPQLADVTSDQQNNGLQQKIEIDRATAARLGVSTEVIDNTLYSAFGQRPVSTMYAALNQYQVVMEVAPRYTRDPQSLRDIYVRSASGAEVPLSAFARYASSTAPLAVNHQGQFPAITLSFNLAQGISLGDAVGIVAAAERDIMMPATIHGSFQGAAAAFQASLQSQPLLIGLAIFCLYIVLGVLYESAIHPVTILSTLPSAGLGAVLALMLFRMDLSVIAMVGIILLIGIVMKNAIIMVDFALAAQRREGKPPQEAIYAACLLRFRPILMTTTAALFGALPLALGSGVGAEMRRPLGITIVGGLIVSQLLTLYTTPVVHLWFDRLAQRFGQRRGTLEPAEALGSL
ncbi:MAG: efflux RND transporter permease subunit [Nevskia sp.]|nr:efflux RND transporter permease subunit [Nevskia sp.]